MLHVEDEFQNDMFAVLFLVRGERRHGLGDWVDIFIPSALDACPISLDLALIVDHVLYRFGSAVRINSGYRTCADNERVGGAEQSAHLIGFGCDLGILPGRLDDLVNFLIECNAHGIIIHETYIHVDSLPRRFVVDKRSGPVGV